MAYKLRRNKWKGVKWIDSPFADRYKRRLRIARHFSILALASGEAKINAIRFSSAISGEEKIKKSMAVANAVISTYESVNGIVNQVLGGDENARPSV